MTRATPVYDIPLRREFFTTWNGKLSLVDRRWPSDYVQHIWKPGDIIHEVHSAVPSLSSMCEKPQREGPRTPTKWKLKKHDDDEELRTVLRN